MREWAVDEDWASALVGSCIDGVLGEVTRLPGSVLNANFLVASDQGSFVVKTCGESERRAELLALSLAGRQGVPVPTVVASARTDGVSWLVIEHVSGNARPTSRKVMIAAGEALARAHEVIMDGFGRVREDGTFDNRTWQEEFLSGIDDDLTDTGAAGLLSSGQVVGVRQGIEAVEHYDGPARLLHGDLKGDHLLARGDQLVSIIDWGDSRGGDPDYDLARWSLEGPDRFTALLDGYGSRPRLAGNLRAYRMRFTLDCLATELRAGGDWFAVYQNRLRDELGRPQLPSNRN